MRSVRARVALGVAAVVALVGCDGAQSVSTDEPLTTAASATSAAASTDSRIPAADVLTSAESDPVEDPYYPDTSNPEVDALHYLLDLDWDGTTLTGTATVTFRAATDTDTVRLDLSDALTASEVQLDGAVIEVSQQDDGLLMETGPLDEDSVHTLTIDYSGAPTTTPSPSQRTDMSEGLGWVVEDGTVHTFQEPYGAFTWYPVNDHPSDEALYDARITTHGGDVPVFNGELVSSKKVADATTREWHLEEPAASYVITIAIGPYVAHKTITPSGMPITYWLMPVDRGLLPVLRRDGSAAYEWLVKHAGPYPFASLGVVVVGGTSAMETETMITMSRGAVQRSDAVLEHEMAHQWFGDSVTPRDWQGLWLNEGWAMYFQQWFEVDSGRPPYAGGIVAWSDYDAQSRLASGPPGDYKPETFGDLNVYLGPALMLDRIRMQIGDAAFEQLARDWAADHEGQTVDRESFETWINDETDRDFGALIDTWLDSPRTPR